MRCRHDHGWFAPEPVNLFVTPEGALLIGHQMGKRAKIRTICNDTDCDAERNIYITQRFGVGYGRVHRRGRGYQKR